MLPVWVQVIIGAAALVAALGVLWSKVVHPAFRLAQTADDLVPLLRDLTVAFGNTPPGVFMVLEEIASEFRTDSGSTLRDAVNKLNDTVDALQLGAHALERLASLDRQEVARLAVMLGQILQGVEASSEADAGVAADLAEAKRGVEHVASDLAESHRRADEVTGKPGEAADAAAQRTEAEIEAEES